MDVYVWKYIHDMYMYKYMYQYICISLDIIIRYSYNTDRELYDINVSETTTPINQRLDVEHCSPRKGAQALIHPLMFWKHLIDSICGD